MLLICFTRRRQSDGPLSTRPGDCAAERGHNATQLFTFNCWRNCLQLVLRNQYAVRVGVKPVPGRHDRLMQVQGDVTLSGVLLSVASPRNRTKGEHPNVLSFNLINVPNKSKSHDPRPLVFCGQPYWASAENNFRLAVPAVCEEDPPTTRLTYCLVNAAGVLNASNRADWSLKTFDATVAPKVFGDYSQSLVVKKRFVGVA